MGERLVQAELVDDRLVFVLDVEEPHARVAAEGDEEREAGATSAPTVEARAHSCHLTKPWRWSIEKRWAKLTLAGAGCSSR